MHLLVLNFERILHVAAGFIIQNACALHGAVIVVWLGLCRARAAAFSSGVRGVRMAREGVRLGLWRRMAGREGRERSFFYFVPRFKPALVDDSGVLLSTRRCFAWNPLR